MKLLSNEASTFSVTSMIHYQNLKNKQFSDFAQAYNADFTMFYALSLGIGSDPMDERQLRFVNNPLPTALLAVPAMATVVGFPGTWMAEPDLGVDMLRVVHGEELIVLHEPMPISGDIVARHRVTRVVDKGPGRGALLSFDKELFDKTSGRKLATVSHTTFCRGDGGFSSKDGLTDTSPPPPAAVPSGRPDKTFSMRTLPQQALLFRLCTDHNPMHSTPSIAKAAGFERPILHGLCTYGMACFALLATWCNYNPERVRSLFTRFSSPVFPGETIRFEMYRRPGGVAFRAVVEERNTVALDFGSAELDL